MGSWPYFGLASPPAWLKSSMSDASGSVAIRHSPWSAASCGLRTGGRDADGHGSVGQVVEPGPVHLEVPAAEVHVVAGEQVADDPDGLAQTLVADPRARPPAPDHVLVEVLARAESQGETAARQHADGRGLLSDDRGVIAERGAGHHGHQREPVGRLRGRAEYRPCVAGVPLVLEPGKIMIGHGREVEPGLLRRLQIAHQLPDRGLLAHGRVPVLCHGAGPYPPGRGHAGRR
jgi:hypothetical protein